MAKEKHFIQQQLQQFDRNFNIKVTAAVTATATTTTTTPTTATATDYRNYLEINYTNNQQYNNEQQQQLQQEIIAVIKTSSVQQQQHVANTAAAATATATTTTTTAARENENSQQQQQQHRQQQQQQQFQCRNQQEEQEEQEQQQQQQPNPYKQLHQLTLRFLPLHIIATFGSSSIRFHNMNMNPSAYMMTAATADDDDDATTLELRRKPHNTKQRQQQQERHKQPQQQQQQQQPHHHFRSSSSTTSLHVALDLDSRSIFYLTLLALFYCCILIRASAAASLNNLENKSTTTAAAAAATAAATSEAENDLVTNYNLPVEVDEEVNVAADDDVIVAAPTIENTIPSTIVAAILSNTSTTTVLSTENTTDVTLKPKIVNLQRSLFKRDAAAAAAAAASASAAAANQPDNEDDDYSHHDDEFDEYDAVNNKSAKGKYIGAPCTSDMKCKPTLLHVTCDKETQICGCEKHFPVQLGLLIGCDKPKKLGDQCFYDETCQFNDENSRCVQVRHNAKCQCASGFHSVSYTKPTRRVFCTQDLSEHNSDLPTLLGVSTGIAVLAGLICMVLHLFSKTKYPRHRNFGDANLPPPILYSSDTVQSGRPSSRSSIRSSGSIGSYGNRRASSGVSGGGMGGGGLGGAASAGGGSKGILVSTSRTGAARSAAILLISCHISAVQSKQNSRATSRQTSGAGCSANSRDNLDENGSGGGHGAGHCAGGGGSSDAGSRSCDSTLSMTRHLQKQLNHQRHLLSLELSPAKTKDNDRIRTLLGLNGIDNYRTDDDDDVLNSCLDNDGNHLQIIGALPTPASVTPRFAVNDYYFNYCYNYYYVLNTKYY